MHLSSAIPWGGTPGKGGDFVKDPVKVLIFPLLGGDTEESKFPSLRGITLSSLKPDKKTVLYTLNEMSCFNSAYMFVTMQISAVFMFLHLRQLEIDLFRLQSPLISQRCKAFGKQTSLISPASRVS